jgi:hypothetical protein
MCQVLLEKNVKKVFNAVSLFPAARPLDTVFIFRCRYITVLMGLPL